MPLVVHRAHGGDGLGLSRCDGGELLASLPHGRVSLLVQRRRNDLRFVRRLIRCRPPLSAPSVGPLPRPPPWLIVQYTFGPLRG